MTVTPQTNSTIAEIASVIRENDDFVLCGHVSPDGDCLGSQLALYHALTIMGKHATCILVHDEPTPFELSFLPGIGGMVPASSYAGPCSVFIGLDVPTRKRIGEAAEKLLDRATISITVDHHAIDTTMCDYVYVDPDSASASMLVWELVKILVDEPPKECALCAYTGIITDTGGFRFQNSDAEAFASAAELVAYGVDAAKVAAQVYQNRTVASLELEALIINRMSLLGDGRIALSWVSAEDFAKLGATKADAEPLINVLRSVSGVTIACVLRGQDDHVRASLRSKDETDVSLLARELGGGGHKAAAGFTLNMPLEDAVPFVSEKLVSLLP